MRLEKCRNMKLLHIFPQEALLQSQKIIPGLWINRNIIPWGTTQPHLQELLESHSNVVIPQILEQGGNVAPGKHERPSLNPNINEENKESSEEHSTFQQLKGSQSFSCQSSNWKLKTTEWVSRDLNMTYIKGKKNPTKIPLLGSKRDFPHWILCSSSQGHPCKVRRKRGSFIQALGCTWGHLEKGIWGV